MDNSVILSVGDTYHLKMGKDRIVYAGMPFERVYSIIQKNQSSLIWVMPGTCFFHASKVK